MIVVERRAELRAHLDSERRAGRTVGFFPTMGYLHDGHAAGIATASAENDVAVVSIFVNPTQFGPGEDFERYPRDPEHDLQVCEENRTSVVFMPAVDEMYGGDDLRIEVGRIGTLLCGASRPWHFGGVATVVAKLWNSVGPCRCYFSEKDFQQLVILRRLAAGFGFPVEVVGTPVVREHDGLAMSSRNVYLSPEERKSALCLKVGLDAGAAVVGRGERDGGAVTETIAQAVHSEPLARLDYAACVDPVTLENLGRIEAEARLAVAAWVGPARLIDNCAVTP